MQIEYFQDPSRKKYLVYQGTKHWIPNSLTRNALGLSVSDFIPKSQDEIDQLPTGENIDDVTRARLIRSIADPNPVYMVVRQPVLEKRHIPDPKTFWALGLDWGKIEDVTKEEFEEIPTGLEIHNFSKWDKDLKEITAKNIPDTRVVKAIVRMNVFGPMIEKADITDLLKHETKKPGEIHTEIDMKAHSLEDFFERPLNTLTLEHLVRYEEITASENHVGIVPATAIVTKRLVEPLISAKRSYCLTDYLASIALCGVVNEMLAILLWKTGGIRLQGSQIIGADEKSLFGNSFEGLGQERRLGILETIKSINHEQFIKFNNVRSIRRKYLHFLATGTQDEKADAQRVFSNTMSLFKDVLGVRLHDAQSIELTPILTRVFTDENQSDQEE